MKALLTAAAIMTVVAASSVSGAVTVTCQQLFQPKWAGDVRASSLMSPFMKMTFAPGAKPALVRLAISEQRATNLPEGMNRRLLMTGTSFGHLSKDGADEMWEAAVVFIPNVIAPMKHSSVLRMDEILTSSTYLGESEFKTSEMPKVYPGLGLDARDLTSEKVQELWGPEARFAIGKFVVRASNSTTQIAPDHWVEQDMLAGVLLSDSTHPWAKSKETWNFFGGTAVIIPIHRYRDDARKYFGYRLDQVLTDGYENPSNWSKVF